MNLLWRRAMVRCNACIQRNRTTNRQRHQHALNGSNSLKSTTTWVVAGKNAQTNAENEKRKENNNLYATFSFDDIRECCSPRRISLARNIQQQIWNVKGVPFIKNNNNGAATALCGDGTQIIIIIYCTMLSVPNSFSLCFCHLSCVFIFRVSFYVLNVVWPESGTWEHDRPCLRVNEK